MQRYFMLIITPAPPTSMLLIMYGLGASAPLQPRAHGKNLAPLYRPRSSQANIEIWGVGGINGEW